MSEPRHEYIFGCACRFIQTDEFAQAIQIEWCGRHAVLRDNLAMLKLKYARLGGNTKEHGLVDQFGEPWIKDGY